jgi:hypothetical protein
LALAAAAVAGLGIAALPEFLIEKDLPWLVARSRPRYAACRNQRFGVTGALVGAALMGVAVFLLPLLPVVRLIAARCRPLLHCR